MEDERTALGALVRGARLGMDQTQAHVCAALGISEQYLSDIEQGRRVPPMETAMLLAGALEIDPGCMAWQVLRAHYGASAADLIRAHIETGLAEPAPATLSRAAFQHIRGRLKLFRERPWHAGRRHGRTLYDGEGDDDGVGYMDSRRLAARVIALTQDALRLEEEVVACHAHLARQAMEEGAHGHAPSEQ